MKKWTGLKYGKASWPTVMAHCHALIQHGRLDTWFRGALRPSVRDTAVQCNVRCIVTKWPTVRCVHWLAHCENETNSTETYMA